MCRDSLARSLLAGWIALAARFEHACDGILGEPVDFKLRHERAQFARDRDVSPRVPEPDR